MFDFGYTHRWSMLLDAKSRYSKLGTTLFVVRIQAKTWNDLVCCDHDVLDDVLGKHVNPAESSRFWQSHCSVSHWPAPESAFLGSL
jgi:hypothetical protein